MTIDTATQTSAYSSGISLTTASSITELADNYDMFVTLLTTQLENQNPLDPTDTDELTQQLLSYSQVEQQILTNQYLENLVLSTNNQAAETALGFVGMEITYDASSQDYDGEAVSWSMDVPDDATSLTLTVENEDGKTVYQTEVSPVAGESYTFAWEGQSTGNTMATEGTYRLVATAELADGDTETLDLHATSVVSEVDWSTGSPVLVLANGSTAGLDSIVSARQPAKADA